MQQNVKHITWFTIWLGFTSMIYFLSLPAHLPFMLTVLIVAAFGFFSFRWFRKNIAHTDSPPMNKSDTLRAYLLFFIGVVLICIKAYDVERKYGHWDAWWLWDHHAKYLQDSAYWRELFKLSDFYHPDYPLFISSLIAFVWRLIGNFDMLVPYTFSIFIALAIPCTIYLSLYRKNLTVAAIAFFLLAFNNTYITFALAQYADQPLGFLFLCAVICLEYTDEQKHMITVIGALLGCCIWMKNEGLLLSIIFVSYNLKTLLKNGNSRYFFAGITFPVLVYSYLKINAPSNDLVKGQGTKTVSYLFDASRYKLIAEYFYTRLTDHALNITICAFIYGIYSYTARRLPGKNMLMLITCAIGFGFVYVFTPHNLAWHLNTSFDRVLFQLIPALVYLMARNMCNIHLSVSDEQFQ